MSTGGKTRVLGSSKKAKAFGFALCTMLLVLSFPVQAQQPRKIPHIGYLSIRDRFGANEERFRQGMRELGYVEGQNIAIEWRFAAGKTERFPDLAAELVRLKVAAIVAGGGAGSVRAAKSASATIPIVMTSVNDPVALGFVASLAQPGGNITGISNLSPDLSGKRLELLKEVIPEVTRVAVLAYRSPSSLSSVKEVEVAAQSLRVQLQLLEVKGPEELDTVFDAAKKQRADALIQIQAATLGPYRQRIIDLVAKSRLPAMHNSRDEVEAGGLMSYGTDRLVQFRRAAVYVDKILKGAKPADLPVEQPTKFELVFNLKTAKQLGLTIPPDVLARADRVIK